MNYFDMKIEEIEFWGNLSFKTTLYRKNVDFIYCDENIITPIDGVVNSLRIPERKRPILVGEYNLTIWNLKTGRENNVDFDKLLNTYNVENPYRDMLTAYYSHSIDFIDYDKLIIVEFFIVKPDYRKQGVTEEFFEMLYNDFYINERTAIIGIFTPLQEEHPYFDYVCYGDSINVKENTKDADVFLGGNEYYNIKKYLRDDDYERRKYKLYSVASRCGLNRIGETDLFLFDPNIITSRYKTKLEVMRKNDYNNPFV